MAIIALRGWYIERYEPLSELRKRPHDIRLSRNSLLKAGLRADFLEEREEIEQAEWFNRYLAGEAVEFYIEGRGVVPIALRISTSVAMRFTSPNKKGAPISIPRFSSVFRKGNMGRNFRRR